MKTKLTLASAFSAFLAAGSIVLAASAPRSATFEVRHELRTSIPDGAKKVRVWFAMPQNDPMQKVSDFTVAAPTSHRITTDSEGNKAVYLELTDPQLKEFSVVETFTLRRREQLNTVDAKRTRPLQESERKKLAPFLTPNQYVIIDDRIRELAGRIVGEEKNPVLASRKLYDWVLANIDYWVKDPANKKASPAGSTEYCLTTKTGNCTDFHSLWTSLARASGIPARMVYGSFFKAELDGQDADQSYHCWPEFYAPKVGWIPHDVAVADIFAGDFQTTPENEKLVRLTTADGYRGPEKSKIDYYFGNIDERRVTWSRGRDLILKPKPDAGPVNAMAKAYVEVDGKVHPEKTGWVRKLTFKEQK